MQMKFISSHDQVRRTAYITGFALIGMAAVIAGIAKPPVKSSIGTKPENLSFRDLKGQRYTLLDANALPAIYLFLSTQCPVSNAYTPRIQALDKTCRAQGVHLFEVDSNGFESVQEVTQHAKERGFTFPVIKDNGALASRLGATITPQAVLVDRDSVVRYRGRIDDNKDPTQVTYHDLRDALDAVVAGRSVPRAETAAFGCAIRSTAPAGMKKIAAVNFTRDIAPILNSKCRSCHRPGEIGPFPLDSYRQAAAWADQIKTYTANRVMPPWKADSHGEFANERRLTDSEIAKLAAWADAGAPEGDPRNLPPTPKFADGWTLGAPDATYEVPASYTLAADGPDVYRCYVIPTNFKEDRYLASSEIRPGNRSVVHHVIAYLDTTGTARKLAAGDPVSGFTSSGGGPGFLPSGAIGGWAPGILPIRLPDGVGSILPKGADIVLEVHYHKDGKVEKDQTKIGLYFCDKPVDKRMRSMMVINPFFQLKPGDANSMVTAHREVTTDITVLDVTPHMHLLGREMTVTATLPDGTKKQIIRVPDWDFNWQTTYDFKEPIKLPKGTRVDLVARYDNSTNNPRNPNKTPRTVTWGEQTTDEMCIAFLGFTVDNEELTKGKKAKGVGGFGFD